jgi:hypothetical protein
VIHSGGVAPILLSPRGGSALSRARIVLYDLPRVITGPTVKRHLERQAFDDTLGTDESYPSALNAGCIGHVSSASTFFIRRLRHSSILSQEFPIPYTRCDGTTRI